MTPRPGIFVSAVSRELGTARQLVANTLQFLGYEPVWQDIFGTEQGDLREMLRAKIDECKGVVQLVGRCYGAEPPAPDPQFGRVSYTQFEALHALQRGKKVWYLFLDEGFPGDASAAEPEELRELQATYRRRLQADSHLYHPLASREALEASVLKLRDDLTRLRRGVKQWAAAVIILLVVLVGAVLWIKSGQQQQKQQLTEQKQQLDEQNRQFAALQATLRQAVTQFPEVQGKVRQAQPGQNAAEVQQRTYEELGKQLGLDPKVLQAKLPQFAQELRSDPGATTYDRANAAYVGKDYAEAERLALAAAHEARTATPPKTADAIMALALAGRAAEARIEYADALRHYRDAAELTDRTRDPMEWAGQQWNIAYVLNDQGKYAGAEQTYRGALEEYRRARGEDDKDVLSLRNNLALVIDDQGHYDAAEKEYRSVLASRTRVLGPEDPDTLSSRNNLGTTLLDEGRYTEAESELRGVLAIRTRVLGTEHPNTLSTRINLANVLMKEGNFAVAEAEYRAVLPLAERAFGPEHPTTLSLHNNLGAALDKQHKFAEAEQEDRAVLAARERVLGPDHPDTLVARINLAGGLSNGGRSAEAEKELRSVLPVAERVLGPEHPTVLVARTSLANVLRRLGRYPEAETEYREVLAIQERVLGPDHPDLLLTRRGLVNTLEAEQKYAERAVEYRPILEHNERTLGPNHPDTLGSATTLSWYQLFARDFAGALATTEAGLKADASYLNLETNHAHALLFLGRSAEAEAIYLKYRGQKIGGDSTKIWEQVILQDFADLEKAGLTHPAMARIRGLLAPAAN